MEAGVFEGPESVIHRTSRDGVAPGAGQVDAFDSVVTHDLRRYMELLKPLLFVYSGVMVVNVLLMALLWRFFKEPLYKYGIWLWLSMLANFVLQGVLEQFQLGSVLAFSTYYLCAFFLVKIFEHTSELSIRYTFYHVVFGVGLLLSVTLHVMGFGFTAVSLPCAIAIAVPMIYSGGRALKNRGVPPLVRLFGVILVVNGLHFLDYPFLRPIPEMALFGFSLALVLMIVLSIYLPVFISKTTSDRYARKLSDEIALRKEVEKDLIGARQQAEVADRAKGEFLSVVSHEFRTPMNGILGMTDLLRSSSLSKEDLEFLDVIEKSGEQLLHLIDRILAFSALDSGKGSGVKAAQFSPGDCVNEAISNVSFKAAEKGIKIVSVVEDTVPEKMLGDALKLTELLTGLIDNAVKFSNDGEVCVRVSTSPGEDRVVAFSVIDHGVGIEPDKLSAIFNAFQQSDSSATRRYGGVGIGLAICKKLSELLGGSIVVESQLGKGATFTFEYRY